MTKQTQCPHCLSVFVITDEQLLQSRGKVRCGSCRQPFRATLLAEDYFDKQAKEEEEFQFFEDISPRSEASAAHRHKAWPSPNKPVEDIIEQARLKDNIESVDGVESEQIDLDDSTATADPITSSHYEESEGADRVMRFGEGISSFESSEASLISYEEGANSFTEETPRFFDEPLSETSIEHLTGRFSESTNDRASLTSYSEHSTGFEDNLHSELSIAIDDDAPTSSDKYWDDDLSIEEDATDPTIDTQQTEIELPSEQQGSNTTNLLDEANGDSEQARAGAPTSFTNEQELIEEVDQLIEEKLLADSQIELDTAEADPSSMLSGQSFSLDQDSQASKASRWIWRPLVSIIVLMLLGVLLTQLWYRQAFTFFENEQVARAITPIVEPIKRTMEQRFDISLPVRRDLSKMHLLSVKTDIHPTRSTTQLLKVSLVNQADISQPYPWFELILSDEDGRLVARRALSPKDYLHNNRLSQWIGPNELRRITIELLAFPKQAHGYELRVLNK